MNILFGDILFGAPGNDAIEGGRGKDVLLLDGILKDYTIEATKQAVLITNSAGDTDTVKSVELFRFLGDGNTYVTKNQSLAQTDHTEGLQTFLNKANVWSAIGVASSNPTDTDSVLSNLKQQVHDAFVLNGGHPSNAADVIWPGCSI